VSSLLAVLGGAAALVAFFALTYWGSYLGSLSATFTAKDFAQMSVDSTLNPNWSNITFTLLWAVPACGALAVLLGGARALGQSIGGGAAGLLILLVGLVGVAELLANWLYVNSLTNSASFVAASRGTTYGLGLGFWLALIGLAAVALGGFLGLGGAAKPSLAQ
jgi:hypothetical protein